MFFEKITQVNASDVGINQIEAKNWNDAKLPIVKIGRKFWFVKAVPLNVAKRELLAYSLCRKHCNTPQVKRAGKRIINRLKKREVVINNANDAVLLVRVAQTIKDRELPNQDLDSATAAELVFSLWIRRRDADVWNRSYTKSGIPVFYDLNACLDFEDGLYNIENFFGFNRYGYAGSWRVREYRAGTSLATGALRKSKDHYNYIASKTGFVDEIERCKARIKKIDISHGALYRKAGYTIGEAKKIQAYLEGTRRTIDTDAERMKSILFSDIEPDLDRR